MLKICYTVLFSNYENLKEPSIISEGWRFVCLTDQPLKSDVWEIKQMPLIGSPQRTARYYKILFHKVFNEQFTLYVDASFKINIDLNIWWERFRSPITVIQHPERSCVYEEAKSCITFNRGNSYQIRKQIERYRKLRIPANTYLIQSGILMRERTPDVIDFCERWHEELSKSSSRDQIAFVYCAIQKPVHHTIQFNYVNSREFQYTKHFKHRK